MGYRWTVYYDGECSMCGGAVRALSRMDWLGQVDWVPSQSLDQPPYGVTWQDLDQAAYLQTGERRLYRGVRAFRMLGFRVLPLLPFSLLLWLPGIQHAAEAVYRRIAANRCRIRRGGPG